MKEGKLSNDDLKNAILEQLDHNRSDILIGPGVGEDCAAIAFGDLACVLTTDPITGATKDIGKLAVHISCNDIASSGVEPVALLMTLLMPLTATKEDAKNIMTQAHEEAGKLGVAIIGGHTEFTSAVNRVVVSVTAVGKGLKSKVSATASGKPGDLLVMSKFAALEGTAIICNERAEVLLNGGLTPSEIEEGAEFMSQLSVLPEGLLAADSGVRAMHDVTEGGIYGAIWEMCQASGLGAQVYKSEIPVREVTRKLCEVFQLDPYRLISSGVMLMAFEPESYKAFEEKAEAQGIEVHVIGRLDHDPEIYILDQDEKSKMLPPAEDELYKIFQ